MEIPSNLSIEQYFTYIWPLSGPVSRHVSAPTW